jgi:hypothetical protein
MAITTTAIGITDTTIYTSSGDTAVTFVSLCNVTGSSVTLDVNIVPSGDAVADGNLMLDALTINANDTYIIYVGGEKILLEGGDTITADIDVGSAGDVTAIVSFIAI